MLFDGSPRDIEGTGANWTRHRDAALDCYYARGMDGGKIRVGKLDMDPVTLEEALARIDDLVAARRGGAVFTPNVDHVVKADCSSTFSAAYSRADLRLADGMPIVWASRFLGTPLPAKVSGSDLVGPLMERAAQRQWRVFFFGGQPGVAETAARELSDAYGVEIVGTDSPVVRQDGRMTDPHATLSGLNSARPDLVLVALGAPKQELWIDRFRDSIAPAVAIGVGASLDFVAGRSRRAPSWLSRAGLEWFYRLIHEPRRLWRRYLVEDPRFLMIVVRQKRGEHQGSDVS